MTKRIGCRYELGSLRQRGRGREMQWGMCKLVVIVGLGYRFV